MSEYRNLIPTHTIHLVISWWRRNKACVLKMTPAVDPAGLRRAESAKPVDSLTSTSGTIFTDCRGRYSVTCVCPLSNEIFRDVTRWRSAAPRPVQWMTGDGRARKEDGLGLPRIDTPAIISWPPRYVHPVKTMNHRTTAV